MSAGHYGNGNTVWVEYLTVPDSGEGLRYDPGNGKKMKEWVIIPKKLSDQ